MKKQLWLLLPVLCLHSTGQAQNTPEERQLQALISGINQIQQELETTRQERSGLWDQIQASEQAIATLQNRINATNARIADEQARLDLLQQESDALTASIGEQQILLAVYIESAWKNGQQEYMKILLNQQDPAQSARMLHYYARFSEARAEKIAAFEASLQTLAQLRSEIEVSSQNLQAEQQLQLAQQVELVAGQAERQQIMDELDTLLSERDQELQRLEFERVEVEILLAELRRAVTELSPAEGQDQPFADLKGMLGWPLEGRLTNRFGSRHELGDLTWEGITIEATSGSEVSAIHHGRVIFSGWFGNSGLLLIIDHGDGYMSLYAHNQALNKTLGDWVSAGETIALAGNTGGQRQAGLYFEIRRNGTAENPVNWLQQR